MRHVTRRARAAAGALCAVVAVLALALPASAFRDDVVLVSRATSGAPGDGPSSDPSVSADGTRVAFASSATTLGGGLDAVDDVFVRDLAAGTTTLVSRAGATGAPADGTSSAPAISGDGRWVAFASFASNLSADDVDGTSDVFLRDLETGAVTLVSRATGADGAAGDGGSFAPAISADGRHVAFHSLATNLSDADGDQADVFVRDVVAGTTTLVSRATGAAGAAGEGASTDAAISADGSVVAFSSAAANLSDADVDTVPSRVLVRDLGAGTTELVSRASGPAGAPADKAARAAAISADGRHVAFESAADDLSPDDLDQTTDVFVRDLVSGDTVLVSRAPGAGGAPADGTSSAPAISADGARVAFVSTATGLSDADADAYADVFLRDLAAGATILVSRAPGPAGGPADAGSREPAVPADAALVAFATEADVIAPGGNGLVTNVVVRDVLGTPAPQPPPPAPAAPPPAPAAVAAPPPAPAAAAVVRCAGVRATIVGTPRRDVIRGTPRRDVIAALGGDDLVRGLGGDDLICLGGGADTASGGMGSDTILGGAGADRLVGGTGRDLLLGGSGHDRLSGGAGTDRLIGGSGRDLLLGGSGRDLLLGGSGRDLLLGGSGHDRLSGGAGADHLVGGRGRDIAIGGRGRDVCGAERRKGCEPRRPTR